MPSTTRSTRTTSERRSPARPEPGADLPGRGSKAEPRMVCCAADPSSAAVSLKQEPKRRELAGHLLRTSLLALALLPASCSSPPTVRVVPRSELELHRDLDTCALDGDALSAHTSWILRLAEAEESYRDDPLETLRNLSVRGQREQGRNRYFPLAELS